MRHTPVLTLLLLLVAAPGAADGPETGTLTGSIVDPDGSALASVTVSLVSDRGSSTVHSGPDGGYRFALLPPGTYTVRAALEGSRKAVTFGLPQVLRRRTQEPSSGGATEQRLALLPPDSKPRT